VKRKHRDTGERQIDEETPIKREHKKQHQKTKSKTERQNKK
jgi:hypothetical protein